MNWMSRAFFRLLVVAKPIPESRLGFRDLSLLKAPERALRDVQDQCICQHPRARVKEGLAEGIDDRGVRKHGNPDALALPLGALNGLLAPLGGTGVRVDVIGHDEMMQARRERHKRQGRRWSAHRAKPLLILLPVNPECLGRSASGGQIQHFGLANPVSILSHPIWRASAAHKVS